MKRTIIFVLCVWVCGVVFNACSLFDERFTSQVCVVVKTADSSFEYEVECPISNRKDKTRTIIRNGTSATCMQYVRHLGGKNKRDNCCMVLSRHSAPQYPVEVCVYDYRSGNWQLKEIIDAEKNGEQVEPSSDSVFNKLREENYEYLYAWDPQNEKLVIPLEEGIIF